MKLRNSLVPSSEKEKVSSKRRTKIKRTVTAVAALMIVAIVAVPLNAVSAPVTAAQFIVPTSDVESAAGLNRRRPAFTYAIDRLAGAAASDSSLASYYRGMARRLEGRDRVGQEVSGIHAVTRQRPAETASSAIETPQESKQGFTHDDILSVLSSVVGLMKAPTVPGVAVVYTPLAGVAEQEPEPEDETAPLPGLITGDLAFETNPAIEQWMNYYSNTDVGRRTMSIGIERSNSYLEMAREEFRKAGVPQDLVWLAFVESTWNPRAVSPAAAGGLWQFIRPTATEYGLIVESGNDERTDPLKQTRVAAAYLHDLYTIFGDWALAMAAYNSGEPRVMGAIVRNGRADFWELCDKELLPKETRDYVPKILAAIRVVGHPQTSGLAADTSVNGG